MKKSYIDNRALAMDILRGEWLIQDDGNLRAAARNFIERNFAEIPSLEKPGVSTVNFEMKSFDLGTEDTGEPKEEQRVMIIPMHGTLTKYDSCTGCSTMEVADILEEYRNDDHISGFVLDIDSPGGSVNAVMCVVNAIKNVQASGKPIVAHVDLCASAAYWVASQCDAIFADNLTSEVGSIGAYAVLLDNRENKLTGERSIEVYAPESSDKNREWREAIDGKTELLEQKLSKTVQKFIACVKDKRSIADDAAGVFSGAMFDTLEAVQNGMIDGQADLTECVQNVFVRASIN